jgi:hypothetical protein
VFDRRESDSGGGEPLPFAKRNFLSLIEYIDRSGHVDPQGGSIQVWCPDDVDSELPRRRALYIYAGHAIMATRLYARIIAQFIFARLLLTEDNCTVLALARRRITIRICFRKTCATTNDEGSQCMC